MDREFEETLRAAFAHLAGRTPTSIEDAPLEGEYYDSSEVPAPVVRALGPRRAPADKFTEERASAVVLALRAGAAPQEVAQSAHVTVATVNRWRRAKPDFARAYEEARVHRALRALSVEFVQEGSRSRVEERLSARERAQLAQIASRLLAHGPSAGVLEVSLASLSLGRTK